MLSCIDMFRRFKKFSFEKPWLRGGLIGVLVCVVIFIFDIVVFNLAQRIAGGEISNWLLVPSFFTGHGFVLLSGFIVPYGFLCKFTKTTCAYWTAVASPGSTPWTLETGEVGYCVHQILTPTDACARLSESIGFIGMAFLLFAIYFALGALIATAIAKCRTRSH